MDDMKPLPPEVMQVRGKVSRDLVWFRGKAIPIHTLKKILAEEIRGYDSDKQERYRAELERLHSLPPGTLP